MNITIGEITAEALEIRAKRKALAADYEAKDAVFRGQLDLLSNVAQILMGDAQNVRTTAGLAYKATICSFKVTDREAWFDWVVANQATDMLTTHINKDQVQTWIDDHNGAMPNGLEGKEEITTVRFRK